MGMIVVEWTNPGIEPRETQETRDVDDLLWSALTLAGWGLTGETLRGGRAWRARGSWRSPIKP